MSRRPWFAAGPAAVASYFHSCRARRFNDRPAGRTLRRTSSWPPRRQAPGCDWQSVVSRYYPRPAAGGPRESALRILRNRPREALCFQHGARRRSAVATRPHVLVRPLAHGIRMKIVRELPLDSTFAREPDWRDGPHRQPELCIAPVEEGCHADELYACRHGHPPDVILLRVLLRTGK